MVSEEAFAAQLAARSGGDAVDASQGGASLKVDMGKLAGGVGSGAMDVASADGGKHDMEAQHAEQAEQGGSGLAFRPLVMTFRDVRYSVPFPKVRPSSAGQRGRAGPPGSLQTRRSPATSKWDRCAGLACSVAACRQPAVYPG